MSTQNKNSLEKNSLPTFGKTLPFFKRLFRRCGSKTEVKRVKIIYLILFLALIFIPPLLINGYLRLYEGEQSFLIGEETIIQGAIGLSGMLTVFVKIFFALITIWATRRFGMKAGWVALLGIMAIVPILYLVPLLFVLTRKSKQIGLPEEIKKSRRKENFKGLFFLLAVMLVISSISIVVSVQRRTEIASGLSVVGTMFWNGEPAELISVKVCVAGDTPGTGIFDKKDKCSGFEQNTVTDASGKYRFFNIPPSKYTIFYKWPDGDNWNLLEVREGSYLVRVGTGVTRLGRVNISKED